MIGLLVGSAPARGASPTSLVYTRAPDAGGCPDEAAFRHAVTTRLGADPFTAEGARRAVEVAIAFRDGGYHATVRTTSKDGPATTARTFDAGERCDELVETVALAISVALDPKLAFDEPSPTPAEPPTPEPREPVTSPPTLGAVGVGAMLGLGEAPAPTTSGSIYGAVRYGWLGGLLEIRRSLSASGEGERGTVTAATTAFLGGGCVHVAFAFGCAVAELGLVTASLGGDPRDDATTFPRFGTRLGVAFPLAEDRFELRAGFDALAVPGHLRITRGDTTMYEWPAGRFGFGVGAGVRF